MKFYKKNILALFTLFFCISLFGQKPIKIVEEQIKFNHGEYPGLILTIPEVNYHDVSKAWSKILEKGTKSKIQIEDGELTIFGALIENIYSDPINIYSLIKSADSAIIIQVTFELKPKNYISRESTPSEYTQAKSLLMNLGKDLYGDLAKEDLKKEEKSLRKLEREMESLYSEKSKLEKSIVNSNSDIQEYSDKIVLLKQDAKNLNEQLGQKKNNLLNLEGETERLEKEKEIKAIEKDKEKALKAIESFGKKILLRKSSIERATLDIESNTQEQANKLSALEKQKAITNTAERKYSTILDYN